jgi:hypothetical protein
MKQSGRKIRFRYGRDAVKTRMYRTARQMWEGWTKNLALLFPSPLKLALLRASEFAVCSGGVAAIVVGLERKSWRLALLGAVVSLPFTANFFYRVRKAHFGWMNTIIAPLGVPMFVILLIRSRIHHKNNDVIWKGRHYVPASDTMPRAAGETLSAR